MIYVIDACDERTFHAMDKGEFAGTFSAVDTPNGRVRFVGNVPMELITDDAEVVKALKQCGGTIAQKIAERRGARYTTSYADYDEVRAAIRALNKSASG